MDALLLGIWEEVAGRRSGPMHFRFVVQPIIAAVIAIGTGWRAARAGRPTFFVAFVRGDAEERWRLFRRGCKDIGMLYLSSFVFDIVYQFIALEGVRPGESLVVAVLLALVPYLTVRSLTRWALTRLRGSGSGRGTDGTTKGGAPPHDSRAADTTAKPKQPADRLPT